MYGARIARDRIRLASGSLINSVLFRSNVRFRFKRSQISAAKQDIRSTLAGSVGETILVRIINVGEYDQSLHFHANHFQIISQDGIKVANIADAPWVTTVNVKGGSSAMVLYTLSQPGTYPVHVHSAHMETGNGIYLNGTATFIIAQ